MIASIGITRGGSIASFSSDCTSLDFVERAENVLFRGPSGVGKTTLAQNLGLAALTRGRTVRFSTLQAPPPPATRVAVAVAAVPEEPAALLATVALVDETPATDTISDTNDPMEHLLAAAERLLGQQTES